MKVLLFSDAQVEIALEEFKMSDYDNDGVHKSKDLREDRNRYYEDVNNPIWNFKMVVDYVEKECKEKECRRGIKTRVEEIIKYVCCAVRKKILDRSLDKGLGFGIYGLDVILDEDLNPWLVEVQIGPSMWIPSINIKTMIPTMVNEAVSIAFEMQDKIKDEEPLEDFKSVKYFEWLIE